MKKEKGITLISLTIYVIVMAIVIGVMAIITTFFYKNMENEFDIDPIAEYTTFNSYFSDEVNHENIRILECDTNYIAFSNGVQYSYIPENKGIYRNKVKICRNVTKCTFKRDIKNGKNVVEVEFTAGNQNRKTTYTLK